MEIIGNDKIIDFIAEHPEAERAMNKWIDAVTAAEWTKHADVKNTFASADNVGGSRYVFNIRGGNYRIVCVVVFFGGIVDIRFVGKHSQYDKINCRLI